MERVLRDLEQYASVVKWAKYPVNVIRSLRVEEDQRATIAVLPSTIELNEQAMCLPPRDVIVVNSNPLTANQFVNSDVDPVIKVSIKYVLDAILQSGKRLGTKQRLQVPWKFGIQNAELELLVEARNAKLPRRVGFKPFEQRKTVLVSQCAGHNPVSKRLPLEFRFIEVWDQAVVLRASNDQ